MSDEKQADGPSDADMDAQNTSWELHHGRLDWLAQHIRKNNFHIDPRVARKLLALIERNDPALLFQLEVVRRKDLPPAKKDAFSVGIRDWEMALEVARLSDFKRGHEKRAKDMVAKKYNLDPQYVGQRIRPYRDRAMAQIQEDRAAQAYSRGEVNFLGVPISTREGFAPLEDDA